MSPGTDCPGCERSAAARVKPEEIDRLLSAYLQRHPAEQQAADGVYASRLAICRTCPDLTFGGTTCRHCGCLVAVRAKLAGKACPAPAPRWPAA